jgi:hypothetical protein
MPLEREPRKGEVAKAGPLSPPLPLASMLSRSLVNTQASLAGHINERRADVFPKPQPTNSGEPLAR